MARTKKAPSGPARRVVDGWTAVQSIALAPGGRIVAGENGGHHVVCWNGEGTIAWQVELGRAGTSSRYNYETHVHLDGDRVLALVKHGACFALDLATGKRLGEIALPDGTRDFDIAPNGKVIVIRAGTETVVCEFPSMKRVAFFEQYCNQNCIAISPDGKWLAVNGHEVHVFDLPKLQHVKTFEPPDSPWATSFTANSDYLVTGDDRNMLRLYDVANGFVEVKAVGKNRKPTITALAVSPDGKWIATANELGTVVVHAAGTLDVRCELKGHDPTQPDTGAKSISALAFTAEGELVVGAPPKKQPAGLTIHTL